jgi:O-antigen ligase
VVLLSVLLFSRYRAGLAALSLLLLVVFLAIPGTLRHRLTLIVMDPQSRSAADVEEQKSLGSQFERQELLKTALRYTFTHPIFGIGPGQFSDAAWAEAKHEGRQVASLGTHNAYLQISSECGLPGLFFFTAAIILSIRSNYRLYKQTRDRPEFEQIRNLAFCLFATTLAFSVNALFHHVAYTINASFLAGCSTALYLAAQPYLTRPSGFAPPRTTPLVKACGPGRTHVRV